MPRQLQQGSAELASRSWRTVVIWFHWNSRSARASCSRAGSPSSPAGGWWRRASALALRPSPNFSLPALPVTEPQLPAQHFAGGVARQLAHEVDRFRCLVGGDTRSCPRDDRLGGRWLSRFSHHDRLHLFAPTLRWHADHGDLAHSGAASERVFDFSGIDVLPTGDNQILDAVVNIEVAIIVEIAGIAGAQPAIRYRLRGRILLTPVLLHEIVTAHGDFTDLTSRERPAAPVHHADLHTRPGLATGAQLRALRVITRRKVSAGAGRFGHSVELHEVAADGLLSARQYRFRHRRSTVCESLQAREVARVGIRVLQQRLYH